MPLISKDFSHPDYKWVVWEITESMEWLEAHCPWCTDPDYQNIKHPVRRKEWVAARISLENLLQHFNHHYEGLYKDEHGKPHLRNLPYHMSLSHSFPYVASIIDAKGPTGIDLEIPQEKILKIAPRFLSSQEFAQTGDHLLKNCIYWCAKEVLYKIQGRNSVSFREDLKVLPFNLNGRSGNMEGEVLYSKHKFGMKYEIKDAYVVVYKHK